MIPIRILHLEDSEVDALLIARSLRQAGLDCTITRVDTEPLFRARLDEEHFDLVLADYSLPTFDGRSALRICREIVPNTPFIIVSGALGESIAVDIVKSGATDYVLKDHPERLGPAVTRAMAETADRAERRRAVEALRESEERFRATFEQAAVGIAHVGVDGRFIRVNQRLCDIVRYTREELLHTNFQNITHPDDIQSDIARQQRLIDGQLDSYSREKRYIRKDKSVVWVNRTTSLVHTADGRPAYFIAVIEDISERKRVESDRDEILAREQAARAQAEEANRSKDHFLSVISHELRTPLTPVLAGIDLLKRTSGLPPEVANLTDMIRRNAELEARLIDDLLDLTRITSGRLHLNSKVIDAHPVIRNALEIYASEIKNKNLKLALELQAKRSYLRADSVRLQQIFWNVIGNAVKFTPQDGNLSIATIDRDETLVIEIRDSGIGIEQEALDRLFQAFEQGERSLSRKYGGLGIGLSICKSLVELHGGTITATSLGKDKGALFTITFSSVPAPATAAAINAPPAIEKTRKLRILLVEDNEATTRVFVKVLRSMGHEVSAAASVKAALDAADSGNFDLLISDIGLPDGSGWELMRQLAATHPVLGIAVSGFGTDEDIEKSRNAGFATHLTKPINIQKLEETIHEVCT